MARPYVGPRLYQRTRNGVEAHWVVRDGDVEFSTNHKDLAEAQKVLDRYCAEKNLSPKVRPRKGQRKYPEATIYFISTNDVPNYPVKIGVSDRHPERRMNQLQNACPYKLVLLASFVGNRNTKRDLHARFAASRLEREWFARTTELMTLIAECAPPEGVSGTFHGSRREKWSERLDSNQRPLTPQKSANA